EARALVRESFVAVPFTFGSTLFREGDEADAFYVLASGRARAIKIAENGDELSVNTFRAGDSFGEMALLAHTTRTATVRASSDGEALRLDKSVFDALVARNPEIRESFELQIKRRELQGFFRQYSAFSALPFEALRLLVEGLETVEVDAGAMVVRQGEAPGPMYVVADGRLRCFTVDEQGRRRYLSFFRKGDYFGEVSLFKQQPRGASVEAVSACKLYCLTGELFGRLIAEQPEFKAQIESRIGQYDYKEIARVPLDFADEMLPADASVSAKVGPEQAETVEAPEGEPDDEARPFASKEGHFVKKARRIRRFPHVRQIDMMDCGAAALAMVCRHYGRRVSLTKIRQLVHTSTDGTSLAALCRAAGDLGLAARSVRTSARSLSQMPLPAIVHWEGNHWIVLYDVDETHVRVADPASSNLKMPRAEFEAKWSGYAALFDYTQDFEKAPEARASLDWLWPFFRPHKPLLLKAVGLAVVVSALQMSVPVITAVIVDKVVVDRDVGLLNVLVLSLVGILLFIVGAMVVQRYLLSFAAVRIDSATLDFLTRKMLALPMGYFQTRRTADIQRRLEGIKQVREFAIQHGVGGLTALIQLLAAVTLMFVYSPLLALVFLATTPLYALFMTFSAKWLRPILDKLEAAFGRYYSYQLDAIKGIETVKAMGAESAFRQLMLREFHGVARRRFNADFTIMSYDGAIQAATFLSVVLFLWAGAHMVMNGSISIGTLVAFNSLVALANAPVMVLLLLWDNLQMASVLLNRLNDVLEQEPEQGEDHTRLTPVRTLEGRVALRGVGFQYGGPESPLILDGLTFEIPPGKRVAIVGRSGSGKTTLIKCLAGLIEPTQGTILFDGVDLKSLNYRDLRRQIGFVLQENYLFDDTIARNIAFGEEEPDMDQVLWAARMANAHEFIERLPFGYDTKVGESGLAISGGQKQRIAIARALYLRPPVIIFDEATSALDTESERAVKENLDQLLVGRTSFVIAHRLSTIRGSDLILVVEKGRLVEQGTHEELMEQRGLYYYLCSQQLGLE
ncbi:MAG TPA: peptidase domain-containing ABC transporter, partial [Nevskiaceae bacterium]|nr:peptidase domain-containing ABC transporter [Nevskiaceae bacterium]